MYINPNHYDPKIAMAWNNKGRAQKALGIYQAADECLDKARQLRYPDG